MDRNSLFRTGYENRKCTKKQVVWLPYYKHTRAHTHAHGFNP